MENIDGTLIPTADTTKIKWNGINDYIILNKIALIFRFAIQQQQQFIGIPI